MRLIIREENDMLENYLEDYVNKLYESSNIEENLVDFIYICKCQYFL